MSDRVVHEVKCWPEFFAVIKDGRKPFEVRVDDRGYQEGHFIKEREFIPKGRSASALHYLAYTGRELLVKIGYIGRNIPGLPKDYVVMAITLES
jgi:hypothetical protein